MATPRKAAAAKKAAPARQAPPAEPDADDADRPFDPFDNPAWVDSGTGEPYPVQQLLWAILAELPAIGKNQRNREQDFMFRGHDDVVNALNPIQSKWGVIIVPDVIERIPEHRTTRGGSTMYEVNLHVRFTATGPAGDTISGSAWGEGTDMGDKATNKAMTNALKYWLVHLLQISTAEVAETDADRHTPPETTDEKFECPRCEETGSHWEHVDIEKFRAHMESKHGYVRQEDGRVTRPKTDTAPATQTPPVAEPPADTPPAPSAPESAATAPEPSAPAEPPATDEPAADDPQAGENPVDDDTTDEDWAWLYELKGSALTDKAGEFGLAKSGKVDEIRQRIRDHIEGTGVDEENLFSGDDGSAEDPDATDQTPPDDDEAEPDDSEPGPWQCNDCNEFPFDTYGEYRIHWAEKHGETELGGATAGEAEPTPEPEAAPEPEANGDAATPEQVSAVKAAIGKLTGDKARAYGRYRRDHGLGKPDDLKAAQAAELLEFLGKV